MLDKLVVLPIWLDLPVVQLELFVIALWLMRRETGWYSRIRAQFDRVARRRRFSIALVFTSSLSISIVLSIARMPYPRFADEFSYLLAADTFAHGRITNPQHPMWEHFESFHIIQQPTYMSKYPPAQGLFLASGQVLAKRPIAGIWLSTALACGAICWMLFAFCPPRWAFLGGLLAAAHPLMLLWGREYWGGSVATLGGAIFLGALGRMLRKPAATTSILMGVGLVIIGNSRPFEGLIYGLPLMTALATWLIGHAALSPVRLVKDILLPLFLVLALAAAAMAYYNWRITAKATLMPYALHESQYATVPPFLWQSLRAEPSYRHNELHALWVEWARPFFLYQQTLSGWARVVADVKLTRLSLYLRPWVLAVPLLTLPWMIRSSPLLRLFSMTLVLLLFVLLAETWTQVHYAAPATALLILLQVYGIRYLRLWRRKKDRLGGAVVRSFLLIFTLSTISNCFLHARHDPDFFHGQHDSGSFGAPYEPAIWSTQRAARVAELKGKGGRHLIIVRYEQDHSFHDEWVYNEADIDHADVVWAREMRDPAKNRELVSYFKDRRVWLLVAGFQQRYFGPYAIGEKSLEKDN